MDSVERSWGLLRGLCDIPRVSREEGEAADYLADKMEGMGLRPRRHLNNVWCLREDFAEERPTLLLNAHIDTVPCAEGQRTECDGETLWARGANDDGASVVTLLEVFATLPRQSYNLVFLASAEEEVSGKNGVEAMLPLLPKIDAAIVGEPTGMQPAIAEKGLMVIDAVAKGVSGHAAREEGVNAIYMAMRDMEILRGRQWLADERQTEVDRMIMEMMLARGARLAGGCLFDRVSPLLGAVKTTVTMIKAGVRHNVIPDRCEYTIDVRSNELYTNDEILRLLRGALGSELTARSTRLASSHIAEDHALVRRAVELGRVPFGSATLSDQALMPFTSMKMGPGESSRSHTADEFIRKAEIAEGIEIYTRLLDGLTLE